MAGEGGTSRVVLVMKSEVFVFKLSWLGFRFMAGIMGLMKTGEAGSDTKERVVVVEAGNGGWIERPFMFRPRRGDGEVIGRCRRGGSATLRLFVMVVVILEKLPKVVAGKLLRGMRLTGESGDEDGEGSERDDESVVESVVVGEESADSEVWVEMLSWCWWVGSVGIIDARNECW